MKKRVLAFALAISLLVTLLVGCGKGNNSSNGQNDGQGDADSEEITLTWVGAGWEQGLKAQQSIEKWNKIHPEIKVEYIDLGASLTTETLKTLDTMIAGGTTVDLTYMGLEDFYNRVVNGAMQPLDSFIADSGDDFTEMYGQMSTDMLAYKDQIYGVPYSANTYKVFYNKTATDAAGIEIPETWSIEEFTDAAKKLQATGEFDYGCVFSFTWDALCLAPAEVSGWTSVVKNDDGTVSPNFDSEILKTTLEWERDLAAVEKVSPDLATMTAESLNRRQALVEGKTPMIIDGPYTLIWMQNYMYNDPGTGDLPFELGVTNMPYVSEEGKEVSFDALIGIFCVPQTAKYPAEAYEFAKFVSNECIAESGNYFPVYTDADMDAATKSFTEYTDSAGTKHTEIFTDETAKSTIAIPYESHLTRWKMDPALTSYDSAMKVLFAEQYGMFMNGEMEFDEWADMMQELGASEIAALG